MYKFFTIEMIPNCLYVFINVDFKFDMVSNNHVVILQTHVTRVF